MDTTGKLQLFTPDKNRGVSRLRSRLEFSPTNTRAKVHTSLGLPWDLYVVFSFVFVYFCLCVSSPRKDGVVFCIDVEHIATKLRVDPNKQRHR